MSNPVQLNLWKQFYDVKPLWPVRKLAAHRFIDSVLHTEFPGCFFHFLYAVIVSRNVALLFADRWKFWLYMPTDDFD